MLGPVISEKITEQMESLKIDLSKADKNALVEVVAPVSAGSSMNSVDPLQSSLSFAQSKTLHIRVMPAVLSTLFPPNRKRNPCLKSSLKKHLSLRKQMPS